MVRLSFSFIFLSASVLVLTGCDKTREALGLERNTPDEFTVQPSQGLVVPPNMKELPTPSPGAPRPHETTPKDQARNAIMSGVSRTVAVDTSDKSKGEIALLQKAGALEDRDPQIRETINREARVDSAQQDSFIKDILSVDRKEPGKVIDPQEEHQRLTGKELPSDTETRSQKSDVSKSVEVAS
ncbi:MAG: DUF3035 domain-containing protein [Pseudomonadota bacterium]